MPAKMTKLLAWSPERDELLKAVYARALTLGVTLRSDAAAVEWAMLIASEKPARRRRKSPVTRS